VKQDGVHRMFTLVSNQFDHLFDHPRVRKLNNLVSPTVHGYLHIQVRYQSIKLNLNHLIVNGHLTIVSFDFNSTLYAELLLR
jgi:hypothetical protein